ncbi:MAG TPA: Clp protease N-terminal domain-containing protein [Micromonosporaceae bacterium]|jgi:hypothetical protein
MEPRLDDLVADVRNGRPDAGPLGHLSDAVLAAQRLGEVADALIGHFVDEARRSGASWTEIGQSLGVTKQAAQKRFVARGVATDVVGGGVATEALARFTEAAQRAIVASQEEARRTGHDHVGGVHVVLGLLHEPESLAARAIEAQGVALAAARKAVIAVLGQPATAVPDHIPYSPEAKKVRELAVREALRLGHAQVGTDDILLAVLRDRRGAGARALTALGIRRDRTERCLRDEARGESRE